MKGAGVGNPTGNGPPKKKVKGGASQKGHETRSQQCREPSEKNTWKGG